MSYMALEVAPFCTRVLAPFYLRVSTEGQIRLYVGNIQEVAFDNLVVKVIETNEQPLLKPLSE